MEAEQNLDISSDLVGKVTRPPSIRVSGSFKSSLSGRLTPRSSPSFRRSPSVRTPPARETRFLAPGGPGPGAWYRKLPLTRRVLPWLVVVVVWGYIALLLQSRWIHVYDRASLHAQFHADRDAVDRIAAEDAEQVRQDEMHSTMGGSRKQPSTRTGEMQNSKNAQFSSVGKKLWEFRPANLEPVRGSSDSSWIFPSIGMVNSSVGTLVGPFQHLEKSLLGGSVEKLTSCPRESGFAKCVQDQSFLLVFHELSMTGSPLAMLELAHELLSCGGKVTVVALSQKGGLLQELLARNIKVLKNKAASFKAAANADFIIAGSAVCASWIEIYKRGNNTGRKKLIWWIMENRKEYFDRSKHMLGLAKVLIFLSEVQLKQWVEWSELEGIVLPQKVRVIPLCVNEELALRSGMHMRSMTKEKSMQQLRIIVRAEMGLKPQDVLLTTLSSINPGKGQLKLLEAVNMVIKDLESSSGTEGKESSVVQKGDIGVPRLRLLIGSVGSKSNKIDYVQKILEFIADHPQLAASVFWTPVTAHVASLYTASDAYVMNSQGLGETFGRVTVEAMAFGLPVLGTSAGGTPEIVDDNISGLLHPVGADGVYVFSQNIKTILGNVTLRQYMGLQGKEKVRQQYMKEVMYENIGSLFSLM